MKSSQILLNGGVSILLACALVLSGCNDDAKKEAEKPAASTQPVAPAAEEVKPAETAPAATPLKEGETPEVKEEAAPATAAPVENTEAKVDAPVEKAPAEGESAPK